MTKWPAPPRTPRTPPAFAVKIAANLWPLAVLLLTTCLTIKALQAADPPLPQDPSPEPQTLFPKQPATEPTTPATPAEPAPELIIPDEPAATSKKGPSGTVSIVGARSIPEAQLRTAMQEQIQEIKQRGLTRPRADDTAYYLRVFYRRQGFPNADVTWEIRGARLILTVQEGARTYLRDVRFTGNTAIPSATLQEYFIGIPQRKLASNPIPFVLSDLQTGVARVRGLYESRGYLSATVQEPIVNTSRNGDSAEVTIAIHEGPQSTFGAVTFSGDPMFPRETLLKALGPKIQGPFAPQELATLQRDLQYFYKSRGYFQANVEALPDLSAKDSAKVPVTFHVVPGALYRFDGITVKGTDRLRSDFLPKRFAALHGDTYDPARLDDTYRDLLRTGLFKTLRIDSVAQPDNTIRLDITAEEAKAKEVGFSIGAQSYEGLSVELRLADRNLFGRGRPLSFSTEVSQRTLRGELLYVDPWFLDTDFRLRSRLFAQTRTETGYTKDQTGLRLDIERNITRKILWTAFLQLQNVDITDSTIEPQYLGPSSYRLGTFGLTQSFDFRDNPVNPTKGWILAATADVNSLDTELAFTRATLRYSFYKPLSERVHLSLGARFGVIHEITEVPIDERFFNGGPTTVRSFQQRQLGPHDRHGNPIGGLAFSVLNAELTFPIKENLQGAVFADAGNVVADLGDIASSDMRYAIGVGFRYRLPIGPLRVDYGINPNPRGNEKFGAFNFTFGVAF